MIHLTLEFSVLHITIAVGRGRHIIHTCHNSSVGAWGEVLGYELQYNCRFIRFKFNFIKGKENVEIETSDSDKLMRNCEIEEER